MDTVTIHIKAEGLDEIEKKADECREKIAAASEAANQLAALMKKLEVEI